MSEPIVPLELQYRILDLVWAREYFVFLKTLRSCALTCRAWLAPSRRRLFRSLAVGPNNRPDQVDLLVSLLNTSPDVSEAVEQLFITTDDEHFSQSTHWKYVRPQVTPIILAAKLPRLRSLIVNSEHNMSSFPDPMRIFAAVSAAAVTSLRLQYIRIDSVGAFRKMLAMFPSLEQLSLVDLRGTSTVNPHSPALMSLPLRLPHLTQIEGIPCERLGTGVLSYLLRAACETLEKLYVSYPQQDRHDVDPYALFCQELPQGVEFPRLSVFKFRKQFFSAGTPAENRLTLDHDGIPSVIALLSVHARRLQTVILSYEFPIGALRPVSSWDTGTSRAQLVTGTYCKLDHLLPALKEVGGDLDEALSSTDFNELERVEIEFVNGTWSKSLRDSQEEIRVFLTSLRAAMTTIFPKLSRRGMLDVTYTARNEHPVWCRWVDYGAEIRGVPLSDEDPVGLVAFPKR